MPEPVFMKLGIYIMASEPFSTPYFINLSHQSVCGPPVLLLRKKLLEASFSMRAYSYQRKVSDQFFPELLVCVIKKHLLTR
jgi:hypothetical protein